MSGGLESLSDEQLRELKAAGGDVTKLTDGTLRALAAGRQPATDSRSTLRRAGDWFGGLTNELKQGALFGLADEAGAGIDATLQTVLPNAKFTDTGQPIWAKGASWRERYDDALTRERAKRTKFTDENPIASIASNVFGGVGGGASQLAAPLARLTAGLSKPVQFAAAGAVPGAVQSFGEGEGGLENRLLHAGGGAVMGGGLGLLAGYGGERIAQGLRRASASGTPPLLNAQGQLTAEGRQAMQAAGIDPDTVSQGFAQRFAQQVQEAGRAGTPVDPAQAARVMQGQSLPTPVPQTRGQVSGSPGEQMFENLAEKGTYGPRSERMMQGIRNEAQDALRANIGQITEKVGGQPPHVDVTIPGQTAQSRLVGMRTQEKAGVDAAYAAARQTQAGVPTDAVRNLRADVHTALGESHAIDNIPKVMNVVRQLDSMSAGDVASAPINRLFFVRAQLNSVIRNGGEDAVAGTAAKRLIDKHIDDIVTQGLLQGDGAAIDAWRNAISKNKDFASRFKGGDLIERLTGADWRSGTRQLMVPPDQATNAIFNSQRLFGAGDTARDLVRLRDVLGPQSQEWASLRQEAVMRLFRQGQGPVNPTTSVRNISGAKFGTALDETMLRSPQLMRTLFTQEEIATLRQFRDVANRTTGVVRGGDNTSNTTVAASSVVRSLLGSIFTSEGAAMRLLAIPLVRSITDYGVGAALAGRTSSSLKNARMPKGTEIWAAPAGGVFGTNYLEPGQ